MGLNAKLAQAGANGSPQIMQRPLFLEFCRLINFSFGFRPAGITVPADTKNKIAVSALRYFFSGS